MATAGVGDRIRLARESWGITASGLARLVDVTSTAVWNWEKNGTQPRPDALEAIAKVLGVTREYLLTGAKAGSSESAASLDDLIRVAANQIADLTGVPVERVKIHVEFVSG